MRWDGMPEAPKAPTSVTIAPPQPQLPRPTEYHWIAFKVDDSAPLSGVSADLTLIRDDCRAILKGDGIVAEYREAVIMDANGAIVWHDKRDG